VAATLNPHPYLRLKAALARDIERGLYQPHQRLPSQRELGEAHDLSHMTVRKAIGELLQEGLIYSRQGRGLFVSERKRDAELGPLYGFTEDMTLRGMRASSRVLEQRTMPATTMLAHTLQVVVGQPLVYLRRLRLSDDEPMAIQAAYLPGNLCPGLVDVELTNGSLYETLRSRYGLRLADSTSAVGAELAGEEEARLLDLAMPAALLVTEQITYLETGQPIEHVRSLYRGDRYQLQTSKHEGHARQP
jgi:GntR family transcriptional regulator